MAVKPPTLFVNKATIASESHARLTWGAAQAGVASGVIDAVATGAIWAASVDDLVLIAAVWVDPDAVDEEAVYQNNRQATAQALAVGAGRLPTLKELTEVRDTPENPFFQPPSSNSHAAGQSLVRSRASLPPSQKTTDPQKKPPSAPQQKATRAAISSGRPPVPPGWGTGR